MRTISSLLQWSHNAQTLLGWKYEEAFEESQKYKVRACVRVV